DVQAEGAESGDGQAGENVGAGGGVLLHDGGEDRGERVGDGVLGAHAAGLPSRWGQTPMMTADARWATAWWPVARWWWPQAHSQSATGVWSRSRRRRVRPAGMPWTRAGCSLTRHRPRRWRTRGR